MRWRRLCSGATRSTRRGLPPGSTRASARRWIFSSRMLRSLFGGEGAGSARRVMSASHLRHLFRAQTGDSLRQFHELQRLRRAKDLLAMSRLTVGREIAHELGFDNPFYFTLRFKKYTGENPTAIPEARGAKKPGHVLFPAVPDAGLGERSTGISARVHG